MREVELLLNIPRSTLSGWFKKIKLSTVQYRILEKKNKEGLIRARNHAVIWHNQQKRDRLGLAETEAEETLSKINTNKEIIELGLALLYLGEGFKKSPTTGM